MGGSLHRKMPVTFGSALGERRLSGVVITTAEYRGGAEVPPHAHDYPSLMWSVTGTLTEIVEGRRLACEPSSVVYKAAGVVHANLAGADPSRVVVVELLPALRERMSRIGDVPDPGAFACRGVPAALALRLTRALADPSRSPETDIEETVFQLAEGATLRQPPSAPAPWLSRVRARLHETPAAPHSLSALAEEAGVHPVYLARAFRRTYGSSVSEYLHERRLDLAVVALREGDEEVGRIGTRLGYFDHAHFGRRFKRSTGWSPLAFRSAGTGQARRVAG